MERKSSRKLKIDKNYTPCPVAEGDEFYPNGIFVFNITKIIEFIDSHPDIFTPEYIDVKGQYGNFLSINESYMSKVKLSNPVILGEIAPGRFNLIDGQHRMEKAHRMGIKKIKAYKVHVEYLQQFLTDEKAYIAHIEYWNGKLNEKVSI